MQQEDVDRADSSTNQPAAPARKLTLWSLSWPLFVEQGLRISIGTVDTLMVSHISDHAVAALGVAWQIVILSLILFNFLGIGSSVVMTHHLGAGDRPGEDVVNPSTGKVIGRLPHATPDDLQRALKAAERAFATWKTTSMGGRESRGRPGVTGSR